MKNIRWSTEDDRPWIRLIETQGEMMKESEKGLVVVWTSGDREVALKMVFMYTLNSKLHGWWEDVRLIVWGPSARLLSGDEELRTQMRKMKEAGIILEACKACAELYGVSESLADLGIDVKYMGQPLTAYIREADVITF